jgi:hypothetical protein
MKRLFLLLLILLDSLAFGQGAVVGQKAVVSNKGTLSPGVASTAIALLTHTTASGNGTASSAISGTGSTAILIAAHDTATPTAPTDSSSNTYTALTAYTADSGAYYVQIFYACGPTVTGSMTFTAHGTVPKIEVATFSGTLTSLCGDGSGTGLVGGAFASSWQPGSITPAGSGELFFTALTYAGTVAPTISGGCFSVPLDTVSANGWTGTDAYCVNSGSTAQNPTWADTASSYGVPAMIPLKP